LKGDLKALTSSASNEWYTPSRYLDLVRQVFQDEIDLDPFSSEAANKIVRARRYFTKEQDAFTQDWTCKNLFTNPPYGKVGNDSQAGIACAAVVAGYWSKVIPEAIILVNSCTGSKWFQPLFDWTVCFVNHRIHYEVPPLEDGLSWADVLDCILERKSETSHERLRSKLSGKTLEQLIEFYCAQNQPAKDNVFVYLGPKWKEFTEVFGTIGRVRIRSELLPQFVGAK
jgi:hypothetical protein